MYLPNDLMNQFDTTILIGSNTTLSEPKQVILEEQYIHSTPTVFPPYMVFWLLFTVAVILTFFEIKKAFYAKIFDIVFFSAVFILSVFVFYLCFISDHNATKNNFNLLWANPLLLYVLIRLRKTNKSILYILLGCLAILLFGFWIIPQSFNPAFFPIWLTLALRIGLLCYYKHKKTDKRGLSEPRFS